MAAALVFTVLALGLGLLVCAITSAAGREDDREERMRIGSRVAERALAPRRPQYVRNYRERRFEEMRQTQLYDQTAPERFPGGNVIELRPRASRGGFAA